MFILSKAGFSHDTLSDCKGNTEHASGHFGGQSFSPSLDLNFQGRDTTALKLSNVSPQFQSHWDHSNQAPTQFCSALALFQCISLFPP